MRIFLAMANLLSLEISVKGCLYRFILYVLYLLIVVILTNSF